MILKMSVSAADASVSGGVGGAAETRHDVRYVIRSKGSVRLVVIGGDDWRRLGARTPGGQQYYGEAEPTASNHFGP